MPAPGDQYNSPNIQNPFEERVVNKFTAQEIATLQSRLNKQLGPEYISYRPGGGGTSVAYLEGQKAIALANDVFGFNGWSSSLHQVQIDFVDENPQNGKISLGLSLIVRVTLKDGTYHEDIGYGSIENSKGKAAAFEKAKKEAATDGLKRALRSFGNVLGNCLYDKDYIKKVKPMKVKPVAFQEGQLHRHPDFAPRMKEEEVTVKKEPHRTPVRTNQIIRTKTEALGMSGTADFDDEFGENFFDGVEISEHQGDEFTFETVSAAGESAPKALDSSRPADQSSDIASNRTTPGPNGPPRQPIPRQHQNQNHGPGRPPVNPQNVRGPQMPSLQHNNPLNARGPQTPNPQQNNTRPDLNRRMNAPTVDIHAPPKPQQPQQNHPANQQPMQNQQPHRPIPPQVQQPNQAQNQGAPPPKSGADDTTTSAPNPPTNQRPPGPPVGFVTSRAAEKLQNSDSTTSLAHLPAFNPHAESPLPKEKRTPGIDHTRSTHIKRQEVGIPEKPEPPAQPQLGGFQRTGGSAFKGPNFINPQQNTNRKIGMPGMSPLANRGAYKPPSAAGGVKRPPLQDVSNQGGGGGEGQGHEIKRPRLETKGAENAGADAVGT
ncbi:hypothetical protein K505DRAFT_28132 [Melanomma pulvis-pyrius CBS 109.77]|uniref:RAD52 homolog n=1 Tax=Melanomma pulvis-pyrius CBS 109.77 TaxID=1314802 RepID=A0A6A6XE74_9PLEO|nr:hypothetical protein K505DRAFT_28132 [Melanomma pulvis-pyrius CBS 109.77]